MHTSETSLYVAGMLLLLLLLPPPLLYFIVCIDKSYYATVTAADRDSRHSEESMEKNNKSVDSHLLPLVKKYKWHYSKKWQ